MKCECGSQFLPTLENQEKCFTCIVIDACKTEKQKKIDSIKETLKHLHNLCIFVIEDIQKMEQGETHGTSNKLYSMMSGLKNIENAIDNIFNKKEK